MAMFNTSSYVITRGYLIFSYIFIYVPIPPGFTSYIPRKSPDIAIVFFHHGTPPRHRNSTMGTTPWRQWTRAARSDGGARIPWDKSLLEMNCSHNSWIYIGFLLDLYWIIMDYYGFIWIILDLYGFILDLYWIIMDYYGFIRVIMDLYGFILDLYWIIMVYSGFIWIILDLYGFILDYYGFIWIYMRLMVI